MRMTIPRLAAASLAVSIAFLTGCGSAKGPSGPTPLKGAGATAPNLAYSKWAEAFNKANKDIKLEYRATGSGEGIKELEAGTVDFAASDMPLDDQEIAKLKTRPLHFPTLISAIVPIFNVPNVKEIQFTGEALAGIFSGKIKMWNDPALAQANPGVTLPAEKIVVVRRSDASGSTYALTDYLSKVSERWRTEVGKEATLKLPSGVEAHGSDAMAETVKKTPNSIGYADLNYALAANVAVGAVKNRAGKFQKASIETQGGALEAAQHFEKDFRGSLVDAPGDKVYPICTLTWLIVPHEFSDGDKGRAMKRFLRWAYSEGQKIASPMDYGILQPPLLDRVTDQVERIKSPR